MGSSPTLHNAMNETTPSSPDTPVPTTAGQWLREARTRQGLHLAMLSAALKVPVRSLEHLEADRYDELPGSTFVRALAQSMCRHLRIDPVPVLALLPEREVRASAVPPSLQSDVPTRGVRQGTRLDRQQLAYAALAVMMVTVIAALLWWPAAPVGTPVTQEVNPLAGPSLASGPAHNAGTEPVTVAGPPASLPSDPVSETLTALTPAPASTAVAASAPPVLTPLPAAASPVQPLAGTPTLRLMASGESWVEVRDAANRVVLSVVMQAGQQQDVVQAAPLKVVLGRAAVMKVQVRGELFDLVPHTKITVARFEVQP